MPIYHDGKKMKPYRGYRKPVNIYYGDKKVAGWKNSTQTGNNLTFQTTYNDTADVVVKGKTEQKSEWVHKQGLTTQDSFAVNDEITVPYRGYNLTFRIVHINGELLTLEMKNVFGSSSAYKSIQFDGIEALYFAEEGLAAGTYNFTLLSGYDIDYGGGKTYQFTLAQDVPAGGCLMFPWGYQVQADTVKISSYASLTATTAIESVSVIEGSVGTSIGVADGNTENMNHTHRIRYGSNNYAQSAIRQLLNSSAAVGSVWTPQTRFDRPPSWHTSADGAYAGFMRGFGEDFLSMVVAAEIPCRTNSVYETASLDGAQYATNTVYNLKDKFFLLSRPEIYGTWDSTSYKDGELLEMYSGMTDLERAKYDAFGTGRYAWLRSPYPSYANNVRDVNPDGVLSGTNATNSIGVAPACNVKISNLQTLIDTGTISYTHANPSPLYPQPLISNLPTGTYKVQDHKGDFYEFTLDEDLHGIGDVRDSVEWDKYSHSGYSRTRTRKVILDGTTIKLSKNNSTVNHYMYYVSLPGKTASIAYCTHFKHTTILPELSKDAGFVNATYAASSLYVNMYGLVSGDNATVPNANEANAWLAAQYSAGTPVTVIYQLATPTRTPLIFTKNNASTAPECPMEFLTDTPSLEYPAEVFDAQGTIKAANADESQSVTAETEILRSNETGTIYDEQDLRTGEVTRKFNPWEEITGARTLTKADSNLLTYKVFKMSLGDLPEPKNATTNITAQKYDSTLLTAVNATPTAADRIYTDGSYFYLSAPMADTGFSEAIVPTDDEIKAYFYGHKMCHASGLSPYYKSEVPYNPTTWAGWTKSSLVTILDNQLVYTSDGTTDYVYAFLPGLAMKTSTKYGLLYNIAGKTYTGSLAMLDSSALSGGIPNAVGNNKVILTSPASFPNNRVGFRFYVNTAGNSIAIKDIRIFELPSGSQIEADFETLTADELAAKYPFDGLNTKHWKKLVGTEAEIQASITSTLPTASYEGFTPYKMIYELAEPIEEQHDPVTLPTYYPTTVITTNNTPAELTTTATVKVEET